MPSVAMPGCRIIPLPVHHDRRGDLAVVDGIRDIPFAIVRVYYLHNVPGGATRAGHAHRQLEQLLIAATGEFNIELDNGRQRETVRLTAATYGLYLPKMVWRELTDFSHGAVCLALASMHFDEADYIRDYAHFVHTVTPI